MRGNTITIHGADARPGRRLRVAVVAPPWFEIPPRAYGGIEWMCAWLVEGLLERGHDVTLIGAGGKRVPGRFYSTFDLPPSARLGEPLPEVMHVAHAARVLDEIEVDVVHEHTLAGPLLARSRRAPTVLTAHGPVRGEMGDYYRLLAPAVDLVAISDAQRRSAPDLAWIATVHNGIPVSQYPVGKRSRDGFVLWMGRMNPEKGPDVAIRVALQAGVPIVLAGKCREPAELAFFNKEVEPLLGPSVRWLGEADTRLKHDLLTRALCFLAPIQWDEPFGILIVEALACGTPVVACPRGSLPELVVEGRTGFLRDDLEGLAKAVHRVDQIDPRACREHAARHFDVGRMVAGYEAAYLDAIERRDAAELSRTGAEPALA